MSDPLDDDLSALHARKRVWLEESDAVSEFFASRFAPPRSAESQGSAVTRAAKDVGEGITEIPRAVLGGSLRAFEQLDQTARDVAVWAEEATGIKLGGVVFDENGVRLTSSDEVYAKNTEAALQALIPDVASPQSVTGKMVRGTAQFLTGFVLTGRIKPLAALATTGKAGLVASGAARGVLSDFSAMDAQGGALSQLLEKFPKLANPVNRYLAGDAEDSAVELRLKQSVEGLGFGLLTQGFVGAVRSIRAARRAKAALAEGGEQVEKALLEAAERAGTQQTRVSEVLGDPSSPLVSNVLDGVPEEEAARSLKSATGADRDVFINWSRMNTEEDVKAVIQDAADAFSQGIQKAQRGVRTWRETTLSAEQLDAWHVVTSRRAGDAFNAEQAVAVRELWARSGNKLREVSELVVADPSDVHKLAFRKMLAVHNAIQEQVLAARTETARALNAWKIPTGRGAAAIRQMEELAASVRGDTDVERAASRILDLTRAGYAAEADAFIYALPQSSGREMLTSLWYASLLSGPHTHARNFIGNLGVAALQVTERKVASLLGRVVGDSAVPDGEALALLNGHVQGIKDALRISAKGVRVFGQAVRLQARGQAAEAAQLLHENADALGPAYRTAVTGETGFGVGKVESPVFGAFNPERLGYGKNSPGYAAFFDVIDTLVSMPTRALAVADEVFKNSAFRAESHAQAYRQAVREVQSGALLSEALDGRIAELVASPTEAARLAAQTYAAVSTFTNLPQGGRLWNAWSGVANAGMAGKLLIPFRRTPYNIATFAFRRTPIAPFMQSWQADVRAGGARAATAWAQFVTGNALLLAAVDLAANGHITGEGAVFGDEAETLRRTGWQPSSVRVHVADEADGTPRYRYFSYRGIEPLGTPFGLAANAAEILAHTDFDDRNLDVDELVIAASMAFASQVTSQQYMSGVSSFFDAMSDPRRYGERWFQQVFAPIVPTGAAHVARALDPTMRMATDVESQLRARTPGLSKDLPPLRNLWGDPITRASGLGTWYDLLSPFHSQSQSTEPIDRELVRLEKWIGKPGRIQTFRGVTVNLEQYPIAYDRLVELTGHGMRNLRHGYTGAGGLKGELNALVVGKHPLSSIYARMTDGSEGGKALQIAEIVNAHRALAREQVLGEFADLRSRVITEAGQQQGRFQMVREGGGQAVSPNREGDRR